MSRTRNGILLAAVGAAAFGAYACSTATHVGIEERGGAADAVFAPTDVDAGEASVPPPVDGRPLCASNECPTGRTTCPDEPFPCGVDLMTDDENCGACGVRCPTDDAFLESFSGVMHCVAGTCRLTCDEDHADCNGMPEDGCETVVRGVRAIDTQNCGGCGVVCKDICSNGACGCPPGKTFCQSDRKCHDLNMDNASCGACGNVCPRSTEQPYPAAWHVIRNCLGGECNKPVCSPRWGDCNGNFDGPLGDGCETELLSDPQNCGGCGRVCDPGEVCFWGSCECPCGAVCDKRLSSDPGNCGGCGVQCPGAWSEAAPVLGLDSAHGRPICDQGVCGYTCSPYWADCDGDIRNGCETDLRNDPLNCGACGVHCDGIEGQPCVEGRCLTKGCDVQ